MKHIYYEEEIMKKNVLVAAGVSLGFLVTLALGLTQAQGAPQLIAIGGVYSLTGPDSSVGKQVEEGYTMAVEEMNKDGGVYVKDLGKKLPLKLVALDMEANPEKAVSRTETLISNHDVKAFVGTTYFSAAVNVLEREKIPAVVVACAGQRLHERGYKYWFNPLGTSPVTAKKTLEMFENIPEATRPKSFIIFEEQSDWGIESSQYFQKEIKKRKHCKLVGVQKYTMLSRDYSPQIMAAKSAGAEVVLSTPIMPDGMSIMRQMKELDYNPEAVVMIRAPDDLPWARALGPIGDYVIFSTGWHHSLPYPGVDELNAKFKAKFNRLADPMTGPAYAAIQIIADSIERAGTLESQKIRDAMVATDMMTVTGPVKFNPNGTNQTTLGPVVQWQKGLQEVVFPEDVATKPLIYPIPKWSER
jgi:branched-chain amino acid transport system substrate-binding protein